MRILMFSAHDTAPGERVYALASALARAGHDVDLIAPEQPSPDPVAPLPGLHVARVPEYPPLVPHSDRLAWAIQLSAGMLERATRLATATTFDVIHALGWETAWAAAAAKSVFQIAM